jgi:hypothetical protein
MRKNHYLHPPFKSVRTWEEVWKHCEVSEPSMFRSGKVTRAIVASHGNGMCAAVEWKGNLYGISGGWS